MAQAAAKATFHSGAFFTMPHLLYLSIAFLGFVQCLTKAENQSCFPFHRPWNETAKQKAVGKTTHVTLVKQTPWKPWSTRNVMKQAMQ